MDKNYLAAIQFGPILSNVLVCSYHNEKLYPVAKSVRYTPYIEKGQITDKDNMSNSLKEMLSEIKQKYKIYIDKVILVLPNFGHKVYQASVSNTILTENQVIGKHQIDLVRNKMLNTKVNDNEIVVLEVPRLYILSDERVLRTPPINYQSPTLSIKSFIHTLPVEVAKGYYDVVDMAKLEISAKYVHSMCQARACVQQFALEDNTIVLNVGQELTTISSFNKSLQIKQSYTKLFGTKSLIDYLMDTLRVSYDKAYNLIKSYFTFNIDDASKVIIDQKKEISAKRICGILLNRISNYMQGIVEDIKTLAAESSFSEYNIVVTGMLNDFPGFVEYFKENTLLDVIAGDFDIIGLDTQLYAGTYGALKLYVDENKEELSKIIKEDDNNEIEVDTRQEDKSISRFKDIFDDD